MARQSLDLMDELGAGLPPEPEFRTMLVPKTSSRPGGCEPAAISRCARAFQPDMLHRLRRDVLGRFRLLMVQPKTVLRWHWVTRMPHFRVRWPRPYTVSRLR